MKSGYIQHPILKYNRESLHSIVDTKEATKTSISSFRLSDNIQICPETFFRESISSQQCTRSSVVLHRKSKIQ